MTQSPTLDELLVLTKDLLETKDIYAVIELLAAQDPKLAADVYLKLQTELYWKSKNVPAMVAVSQAGISHGLAAAVKTTDISQALELRGRAKALAYNLASFTWPGWDEKDVILMQSDIAIGLAAAGLNVRLAEELEKPEKAKANAQWMLGAQQLAAGQYQFAIESFVLGKAHALRANDAVLARMIDGYSLLARTLLKPEDAGAITSLDEVMNELKNGGSEDGKGFAEQLIVAKQIFTRGNVQSLKT